MSRPNLYRHEGSNNFFCAHDFAREKKITIRKARRILSKMVTRGELLFLKRHLTKRAGDNG
jgi:hypothetical protein